MSASSVTTQRGAAAGPRRRARPRRAARSSEAVGDHVDQQRPEHDARQPGAVVAAGVEHDRPGQQRAPLGPERRAPGGARPARGGRRGPSAAGGAGARSGGTSGTPRRRRAGRPRGRACRGRAGRSGGACPTGCAQRPGVGPHRGDRRQRRVVEQAAGVAADLADEAQDGVLEGAGGAARWRRGRRRGRCAARRPAPGSRRCRRPATGWRRRRGRGRRSSTPGPTWSRSTAPGRGARRCSARCGPAARWPALRTVEGMPSSSTLGLVGGGHRDADALGDAPSGACADTRADERCRSTVEGPGQAAP